MTVSPEARRLTVPWCGAQPVPLDYNGPQGVAFEAFEEGWVERPALELFADVAARYPDNIACEDIDARLTFTEVWASARRLAARIDAAVAPGRPVGVLLANQASYAIAVLACLGAARPCVLVDRNYPQERVGRIVRHAGLAAVVLGRADIDQGYLLPAGVLALDLESALEPGPTPQGMPAIPPRPDAPCFVVYTSGSTGDPKGIVLSQRGVLHRAAELVNAVHLRPDDKVLSLASPGTIGGLQQIFEVMLSGASLVKLDLQRLGLGRIVRAVAERRITMMFSTPAVWRSVAQLEGARESLASLRCIQSSGDTLLRVDYELVRSVLPLACHVLSVYGATEAPALLQWFVASLPPDEVRVPAGYPLGGFEFAVLDDDGHPAADGKPGEFVIRSRFTSLGMWQDGRVATGPFELHPESPDTKVYRTGDLVRRRTDGLYIVLGRRDRQVKILGNRVELAEIETALRRMPSVLDAAVVAERGATEPRLLGFVVPRAAAAGPTFLDEVRRDLGETLPAYMRPHVLMALDSLPLLPGRKIDEDALLAHATRVEAGGRVEPASMPAPSRRSVAMAARAWRSVLSMAEPRHGVSFDEAGGDSLKLLQLVFELERLAEHPLPLDRFHGRMTSAQMASELDRHLDDAIGVLPADTPALFLFPPAGGGDAYLTGFRVACGERLTVRQVAYPDLLSLAQPNASFEGIAGYAVHQIMSAKPEGPVLLIGYSDGGEVAYEAARQLRANGRDVARLFILDTDASGLSYPVPPGAGRRWSSRLSAYVRPTRRHVRRLIESLVPERLLRGPFGPVAVRLAFMLPNPLPAGISFIAALKAMQLLFSRHHRRWIARSPAVLLDVPVVLFHSDELRPGAPDDLGWRRRTRALTIVRVPGNHSTMLEAGRGEAIVEACIRSTMASPA